MRITRFLFMGMLFAALSVASTGLSVASTGWNLDFLKPVMWMPEKYQIDYRLKEILEVLSKQDKEGVKALFSQTALSEAEDFDEHLDYLLDFFVGDVQSWEKKGSSFHKERKSGHYTQQAYAWYQVETDQQSYLFIFIDQFADNQNQKNVGLYTLRVICAKDGEKEFHDLIWTASPYGEGGEYCNWDPIIIPGIYKPESTE